MNPGANLLDTPALAAWLSINPRHVRRLIQERRIASIKVGRLVRFDPEAIERWLDQNRSDRQTSAASPPLLTATVQVPLRQRRRSAPTAPSHPRGEQLRLDS